MRQTKRRTLILLSVFLASPFLASARDLVYTPVNPTFGGSPLNGPFILGQAAANNSRFLESPEAKRRQRVQDTTNLTNDPAAQFQRQITSSLLSQIASTIGQQILGENAKDSGTFSVGGTSVQFQRVGGQIEVNINEGATGGQTRVTLPVPNF